MILPILALITVVLFLVMLGAALYDLWQRSRHDPWVAVILAFYVSLVATLGVAAWQSFPR